MTAETVPGTSTPTDPESPAVRRPPHRNTCSGCDSSWASTPTQSFCHCGARECHRLFSGARLFAMHRSAEGEHGTCLDPAGIVDDDGKRVMFLRGGVWRGPEMSPEAAAKLREIRS